MVDKLKLMAIFPHPDDYKLGIRSTLEDGLLRMKKALN